MGELSITGLDAGYGGVPVVRNLTLHVRPGEVLAILGANGAGKSTTLLAIAGLLRRVRGEILVDGRAVSGLPHRRARHIGMVLEGRSVFPSLTLRQNLRAARVRTEDVLAIFPELTDHLDKRAGLLSGGQQQMLSLGRALCRRPEVLLIDELSFGLAPIVCQRLFRRIRDFADANRAAVVLVEQHIRYAAEVADRVVVMRQGEAAIELPATELEGRADEIERIYLGGPAAVDERPVVDTTLSPARPDG
jgi:branched-chain amino acid transport system ATP-binding protein